jgi:hypothetical protein
MLHSQQLHKYKFSIIEESSELYRYFKMIRKGINLFKR